MKPMITMFSAALLSGCWIDTPAEKGMSMAEWLKVGGETALAVVVVFLAFYFIWCFFDELVKAAKHAKQVIVSRIYVAATTRFGRRTGNRIRPCDDKDETETFTKDDLELAGREIIAIGIFAGLAFLGLWIFLANLFEPI